jgi:hypothetical protein
MVLGVLSSSTSYPQVKALCGLPFSSFLSLLYDSTQKKTALIMLHTFTSLSS